MATPLSRDLLHRMDAYWRAANYLSVGQIYLYDNPLLRTPLKLGHLKPRLLGRGHDRQLRTPADGIAGAGTQQGEDGEEDPAAHQPGTPSTRPGAW